MNSEQKDQKQKYEYASEFSLRISADTVQKALAKLVEEGEIDTEGRDAIWWFYNYCQEKNLSLEDAGKAIRKDSTTVYRLLVGRYGAKYDNLLAEIARFRSVAAERDARRNIGFIETSVWKSINEACNYARINQERVLIYGPSQIGKTFALEEYQRRNNHGQTRLVRMPSAPTLQSFLNFLADACHVPHESNWTTTRSRIFASLDDRMLLIVDEAHEAFVGCSQSTSLRIMEFIREVHDRSKCGVVISGTKLLQHEIERGKSAPVLEQMRRRGIVDRILPDVLPRADVLKFAEAFGLPAPEGAADEIIRQVVSSSGIKQVVSLLRAAGALALKQRKPLSWDHFVIAYDVIVNQR